MATTRYPNTLAATRLNLHSTHLQWLSTNLYIYTSSILSVWNKRLHSPVAHKWPAEYYRERCVVRLSLRWNITKLISVINIIDITNFLWENLGNSKTCENNKQRILFVASHTGPDFKVKFCEPALELSLGISKALENLWTSYTIASHTGLDSKVKLCAPLCSFVLESQTSLKFIRKWILVLSIQG